MHSRLRNRRNVFIFILINYLVLLRWIINLIHVTIIHCLIVIINHTDFNIINLFLIVLISEQIILLEMIGSLRLRANTEIIDINFISRFLITFIYLQLTIKLNILTLSLHLKSILSIRLIIIINLWFEWISSILSLNKIFILSNISIILFLMFEIIWNIIILLYHLYIIKVIIYYILILLFLLF